LPIRKAVFLLAQPMIDALKRPWEAWRGQPPTSSHFGDHGFGGDQGCRHGGGICAVILGRGGAREGDAWRKSYSV